MSDGTTYSGNRTIVPPGTNVTLNLTFQSDFLPLVRWMFTNLTNVTIEIDFVNNPSFEMSSPVLIDVSNEIYQVMNEWMEGLCKMMVTLCTQWYVCG